MALGRRIIILAMCSLLHSNLTYAATGTVNTNADTAGTAQTGSLRQVINYMNASGTEGSAAGTNTINITAAAGTITLGSDLPVIQKGVTINSTNGTTISGASAYRLFATYQSSLSLQNLTLQNGKALGGNGGGLGGGGMGAGGAVYVDLGQILTLTNIEITSCSAIGGAGGDGSFVGSGGGGASFTGVVPGSTKNGSYQPGGGDYPGLGPIGTAGGLGGATAQGTSGYGGGAGGAFGFSGGAAGGSGMGEDGHPAFLAIGGYGGYCGGGGGGGGYSGVGDDEGSGGGGGNGGGSGSIGSGLGFGGGGGGGYGSGGGSGYQDFSLNGSSGGGGGFGGGGGGAHRGGGGGGGFGGGAGGTAGGGVISNKAKGGAYGGHGDSNGGGGAGIGGAVFTGDSSQLVINGTSSMSLNVVAGGNGSNSSSGVGLGQDIFIFRGASVLYNGSSSITTGFLNADNIYATGIHVDAGVTVSTTSGAIITYGAAATYQGDTTITDGGTLESTGGNLPGTQIASSGFGTAGNLIIQSGGTFSLTDGTFPTNTAVTIAGTMNINGTGSLDTSNISTYTGTININASTAPITSALTGGTGSILNIGNPTVTTYTPSASISNVSTVDIFNGSTLSLSPGVTISGFGEFIIDGTFAIANGASFTMTSSNNLTGSGTGVISNSGQVTFDGTNINFDGSFSNNTNGVMTVTGVPTINLTGPTFTNQGNIIASFSASNHLPLINIPNVTVPANLDLSHGIIQISYNNDYIAGGDYTLIAAGTPPVAGASVLPATSYYITNWSLATVGNNLVVRITRPGFAAHTSNPLAKAIGNWLEDIGANNPSSSSFILLDALETIENDSQLTTALLTLLPPQYTTLVTLQNLDQILGALDTRLVSLHRGYTSGDDAGSDTVSAWIRPFTSTGTQQQHDLINGYTDKNRGYIIGMDRSINRRVTLGAAASYSKTTVTDALQSNTITNINTYQFTFYATLKSAKDIYVDTLVAGGVSNYHSSRTISFPGYTLGAASNFSSQQLTFKVRASKNFALMDFWQFTPDAMAQYSFVRQLPFTENGAGSYNISAEPDNINLFRLGIGAKLGIPFTTNNMLSIPSVYAQAYVDAAGGGNTVNSQFISGGPIITNTVQSGRMMLKYGAVYELKLNDHLEFVANYDYIWRNGGFKGNEGLLNFRYTF